MRSLLPALAALELIGACAVFSYENPREVLSVVAAPGVTTKAQIQVLYRVSGRGNTHDPLSLAAYEYVRSDWLYVNSLDGRVEGPDIGLSAKPNDNRPLRIFEGFVSFSVDHITIELQRPKYRSDPYLPYLEPLDREGRPRKIEGWVPYELNGTYKLVRTPNLSIQSGRAQARAADFQR